LDFNPLGEFVDGYYYEPVDAWGGSKWSHRIETAHGKGPRWRNCVQGLNSEVLLFGKELTSFEPLYEVFCVGHGRGPVESRLVRLTDQVGKCCVATTLAAVNLSQEL
jgi:hypothetical protein